MFDKCVLFNLHASKPVWAGCVSSLYYIIQNIFLCSIIQNVYTFANKIYIHTYICHDRQRSRICYFQWTILSQDAL